MLALVEARHSALWLLNREDLLDGRIGDVCDAKLLKVGERIGQGEEMTALVQAQLRAAGEEARKLV